MHQMKTCRIGVWESFKKIIKWERLSLDTHGHVVIRYISFSFKSE